MYVHSVKLVNFKSFGDYQENEIILEPKVTAIIGKNESGKSNVLDGLSRINFFEVNTPSFNLDIANRNNCYNSMIKYIIKLKPSNEEIKLGISDDTLIIISSESFTVTGGFLSYYLQEVYPAMEQILNILGEINKNPFQLTDQELRQYQKYYKALQEKHLIDIPKINKIFKYLDVHRGRIDIGKSGDLRLAIKNAYDKWLNMICLLPVFVYRSGDRLLNSTYRYDDLERGFTNPAVVRNDLLSNLVKVIGVTDDDFLYASNVGVDPLQINLRKRINQLVNECINKKFNDFYHTENIYLELDFNGGIVSFLVRSGNGATLLLSERSNGLKWYLDLFIDSLANNFYNRNVVYLLDEPGISLHVNAQRELLSLFSHLAEQGNQVVYTTHSPYMLDTESEGIHRIRAVVKDADGYSRIYKTAYDYRIAPESQQDTLAPIISALGMNLQDTFGPAKDKINIVVEGMSDYIYITTMAKILGIDLNQYTFIPSVGATNCVNICAILHGWGCKYIALFDYDKEGVESGGEIMRNKFGWEYKQQYCYLMDVPEEKIKSQSYKESKFMIEDVVTQTEIDRFRSAKGYSDADKTLIAKLMCNALESNDFELSKESKDNFQELFKRVFSYC